MKCYTLTMENLYKDTYNFSLQSKNFFLSSTSNVTRAVQTILSFWSFCVKKVSCYIVETSFCYKLLYWMFFISFFFFFVKPNLFVKFNGQMNLWLYLFREKFKDYKNSPFFTRCQHNMWRNGRKDKWFPHNTYEKMTRSFPESALHLLKRHRVLLDKEMNIHDI